MQPAKVLGHGNILEGAVLAARADAGNADKDQVADDLGGRATGQDIIGTKSPSE